MLKNIIREVLTAEQALETPGLSSPDSEMSDLDKRWDKLKEWSEVKEEVRLCLQDPDNFDHNITLEHGPQLIQTMRHCCNIRCSTHFTTKTGETFVTHYSRGTVSCICVWTLNSRDRDAACVQERFEVSCAMSRLIFIPKYRVFVGFSPDMMLRVYTDAKSRCQEVSYGISATTVLCLAFNRDTNEVTTGCIGAVETWRLKGAEHAAVLTKGRKFAFSLQKDDWVLDIQVDNKNKQLLAVCETALLVLNYEKNVQTHYLVNRQMGSMKCCCVYNFGEYLITGSGDGSIKVWNSVVFNQVHAFDGHHDAITALQTHRIDPLLFSSSADGSVQIWRMDNFQRFMRLDLGEPVLSMKLLGETRLFCQTEKEIKLYNLNQFFSLFAPVESTVYCLKRMQGMRGRPSRIIASCEDGSMRFFSPINGVTVTIVYPMPSFQVLTCFVYNMVDHLMYALLLRGEVLVIKCSSNPCRAVRILSPEAESSEVLDLALVHMNICELPEAFVFGGLRNGQICLLDAKHYRMPMPTQAHHGRVVCLEVCTEMDHDALGLDRSHGYIISGGTDYSVRLWRVDVLDYTGGVIHLSLVQQFDFTSPPSKLVLSLDVLCATFKSTCALKMYKISKNACREQMDSPFDLTPMYHSSDYDHTAEITSLDLCPAVGTFVTSSCDGSVKVWDMQNTLIRELSFSEGINGVCFANRRGDLLIGFQDHIVSVPLLNYLPLEKLEILIKLDFKDERREAPVPYDHQAKPWFDPRLMERHYLQLEKRLMFDERARTVSGLEELDADLKAAVFAFGEAGRFETIDGIVQIVVAEDAQFTESIRRKSILHRQSIQLTSRAECQALSDIASLVMESERRKLGRVGEEVEEEEDEGLGEELGDYTPTTKVIQIYDPLRGLSAWDRELLKRKPIIAPDGYIPNSVIRGILSYARPGTPKEALPWKPKAVPRADPKHLPPGWEEKLRAYEEEEEEKGSMSSVESSRKFVWADDEEDESKSTSASPTLTTSSPTPSFASYTPREAKKKGINQDLKSGYKVTSANYAANKVDWDFDKPQSGGKSKRSTPASSPRGLTVTPGLPERQRSFRRQVAVDDMGALPVQAEDTGKKKKRKSTVEVDMNILQKLMAEDWFPKDKIYAFGPAVQKLLQMLEMFGKTPAIHEQICDYIVAIQEQIGLPTSIKRKFQERLLDQLPSELNGIRTDCVRTLRDLGMDTSDIITALLPKLVDPARDVRQEAVIALVELTGVNDKESLGDLLQKLGVTRAFNTREDEENAMKILRENLGLTRQQSLTVVESFHDWISDWVTCSIPGVFEGEEYMPTVEGLITTGSSTGKRVQIVSPDEENDSSLERKRKNSTSSRRKSFSKRRPSKVGASGGRSPVPTEDSPRARRQSLAGQGRRSSKASDESTTGARKRTSIVTAPSPERKVHNTPEPTVSIQETGHSENRLVSANSWESETPVLLRVESRFRPKEGSGHRYPSGNTEGSTTSRDAQDSGRVTSKSQGDLDRQETERVPSRRLLEYAKLSMDKDSDLHSMSASVDSTDNQDIIIPTDVSHQTEIHSSEGLSIYDSGIGRDISDASSHGGGKLGPVASYKKKKLKQRQLSPVKSSSNGSSPPPASRKGKHWKEFFETPTAVERKRLGLVKKDFEEGNMKKMSSLPPISYISSNLPTSPGEAGLRLLHTVRVVEKDKSETEKHKVEAVPGRLSVHTQNVDSGRSNFGVLQMQWTTNVPVVPVSDVPRQKKSSHMTRSHDPDLNLPPLDNSGITGSKPQLPLVDMMDSMRFPAVQSSFDNDYEWDKPMPPPPVTKSRTVISPVRRCAHEHMCRHYKLAKKKMHHYISDKSPSLYHSRARGSSFSDLHLPHLNKTKPTHHAALPPLKLRVLIDCIKVNM